MRSEVSTLPAEAASPADTLSVALAPPDFARGGQHRLTITLRNLGADVLRVKLEAQSGWLSLAPSEVWLGAGEGQTALVLVDTAQARAFVRTGGGSSGAVRLISDRPRSDSNAPRTDLLTVLLPVATCPACQRALDDAIADGSIGHVPEFCPFCFERLRACPTCGALNSYLDRMCRRDPTHVVRAEPNWSGLGGGPAHEGYRDGRITTALSRSWSFPSTPPLRRENALAWSAPASAYGLIAAASATPAGDAHLYGFEARTGALLWDAYPLPAPIYPDRGGVAIAEGRLFAATVEGVVVAVDVQRGTRLWEVALPGRVYGAVTPSGDGKTLAVALSKSDTDGALYLLDARTGKTRYAVALPGSPDCAPSFVGSAVFAGDDSGHVTSIDGDTGAVLWKAFCDTQGFNAAPIAHGDRLFCATGAGAVYCFDLATGSQQWHLAVTSAPFSGTPACDGALLYLPADDGLHLVSSAGRSVRRYPTRVPVRSAPVVSGGTLLFGATDGAVYGASSGRTLEKLYETSGTSQSGSQFVAAPAFSDGLFFIAATNGVLYALTCPPA